MGKVPHSAIPNKSPSKLPICHNHVHACHAHLVVSVGNTSSALDGRDRVKDAESARALMTKCPGRLRFIGGGTMGGVPKIRFFCRD